MENVIYTITLADGTTLEGLTLNGNNYISNTKIDASIFDGNLHTVTIVGSDDSEVVLNNAKLLHCREYDNQSWIVLDEYSKEELDAIKIRADIDFIAAMSDIDLEEV